MFGYYAYMAKQASAELDYKIDWGTAPWLETGDTIATSAWTVPSGITEVSSTNDTTTATIVVSGGTANNSYDLVNTITTANGLEDHRTIRLEILPDVPPN